MKHLHFVLLLALPLSSALASSPPITRFGIISDIDDTIRPTGSLHPTRALEVTTGVTGRAREVQAFSGMSKLYQVMLDRHGSSQTQDTFFVSGAGKEISEHLHDFLNANDFSTENIEDPTLTPGPINGLKKFKEDRFKKILKAHPDEEFIFFGDDTQKDADSIAWAQKKFKNQVTGAYIHSIEGVLPAHAGQTSYFTAVDVALHEAGLGFFSLAEVKEVADAMLADPKFDDQVIPSYAKLCPSLGWLDTLVTSLSLTISDPDLKTELATIEERVGKICVPGRKTSEWPVSAPAEDPTP